MSLFEKLNNKRYNLQEKAKKSFPSGSFDPANQEGKFVKNERGKNLNQTSNKEISKRLSASTTKGDQARSQYGTDGGYGDSNVGDATQNKSNYKPPTKKQVRDIQNRSIVKKLNQGQMPNIGGTATVTGDVTPTATQKAPDAKTITKKYNQKNPNRKEFKKFFDPVKAKAKRDAFQAGRKAYTTSKTGIKAGTPTKQGIINYIAKARTMRQGSNANVKANKKAAEIIYKSSGQKYADIIRKKYETDKNLPRRRPSNAPSYAQVKAKIDAKEKAMRANKYVLKVAEKGEKGTSKLYPGFDEISKKSKEGRRIIKQFATAKQLTGEPPKPLTRLQKIKKAVTTGWKIPKDTGNFDITTRGTGKNLTKVLTRKSYKPNLLGTVAKNIDKVPNRYKALAAAGLITYGLLGRNKTTKADTNKGAGAGTAKPKVMKYTTGTTKLRLGGSDTKPIEPDF